jgi:glyoxylase-like metal-dependent hydrolase (beta-lactamase superfamily II)
MPQMPRPSRRRFLQSSAALAGAFAAGPVLAGITQGKMQIDVLSDGHLVLPGSFILGPMPAEQIAPVLDRYGLNAERLEPECNLTLMRDGTNTVLFDVGSGPDFAPTAGMMDAALDALEVSVDDITHVVFTHAHPDHLWGVLDDFDDPKFPNASYMMGAAELDYWRDPNTVDTIGDARAAFAVGAVRRIEAIEDQLTAITPDTEILPGIFAHSSFGHTPGHLAFELRDGTDSVMVVGDAIGNHHVGFELPALISGSDQDGDLAATTRQRLLDQMVQDKMQLVGFHLPGGLGRVERGDTGYRFVAEGV